MCLDFCQCSLFSCTHVLGLGLPLWHGQQLGRSQRFSPINPKRVDISRSSINWWVYMDLRQIVFLTAQLTPYSSPCLLCVSSWPEQKTRYPAAEHSVFPRSPCFLQAYEVTPTLSGLRQHALGVPIPVPPFHSEGAHIVGRYTAIRASFCLAPASRAANLGSGPLVRPRLLFFPPLFQVFSFTI